GFLNATLVAGIGLVASARAEPPAPRYKYIDIHTHLGTFHWGKELTADELVRMMDRHHIEKAVVLPLVSPESAPYLQTSEAAPAGSSPSAAWTHASRPLTRSATATSRA